MRGDFRRLNIARHEPLAALAFALRQKPGEGRLSHNRRRKVDQSARLTVIFF
jgi:hypothetical protein